MRRVLPLGHRSRVPHAEAAHLDQAANQRRRQALAHRPALELHVPVRAGSIALGEDASLVHDDERRPQVPGVREQRFDRFVEEIAVDIRRERRVRQPVAHRPGERAGVRERADDRARREEHLLGAFGQDDAALIAQVSRPRRDAVACGGDDPAPIVHVEPHGPALVIGDRFVVQQHAAAERLLAIAFRDPDGRAVALRQARERQAGQHRVWRLGGEETGSGAGRQGCGRDGRQGHTRHHCRLRSGTPGSGLRTAWRLFSATPCS
jgi:hypothetical protein